MPRLSKLLPLAAAFVLLTCGPSLTLAQQPVSPGEGQGGVVPVGPDGGANDGGAQPPATEQPPAEPVAPADPAPAPTDPAPADPAPVTPPEAQPQPEQPQPDVVREAIAIGDPCGNADVCVEDGLCVLNVCVAKSTLGETGALNGQNNKCSADDCCAQGLECLDVLGATQACWQQGQGPSQLEPVTCRGEARSFNDTSSATNGIAVVPDNLADIGNTCDAQTCCTGNLVCLASVNRCAPQIANLEVVACGGEQPTGSGNNGGEGAAPGLGQACSETTCCTGDNVCYEESRICGPRIPGFATIGCNGAAGEDSGVTPNSCSVSSPCARGQTCVANYCVENSLVPGGVEWGWGNSCDEETCCPNDYVCLSNLGGRCAPRLTNALGTVTCRASGAATSGQTINSDNQDAIPQIVPITDAPQEGGNSASALSTGAAHFAVLAGAALVMAFAA